MQEWIFDCLEDRVDRMNSVQVTKKLTPSGYGRQLAYVDSPMGGCHVY